MIFEIGEVLVVENLVLKVSEDRSLTLNYVFRNWRGAPVPFKTKTKRVQSELDSSISPLNNLQYFKQTIRSLRASNIFFC